MRALDGFRRLFWALGGSRRLYEGSRRPMGAIEGSKEGLQNALESSKILYEGSRRRYDALEGFQKALEGP